MSSFMEQDMYPHSAKIENLNIFQSCVQIQRLLSRSATIHARKDEVPHTLERYPNISYNVLWRTLLVLRDWLYDSPTSGEPAMLIDLVVGFMVFNATFNNISVISCISVLLVEQTRGQGETHRSVASHWQMYHIMLYTSPLSRFELTISVVIGSDWIGSCISNYHTITATNADWNYQDYRTMTSEMTLICHCFCLKHYKSVAYQFRHSFN